MSSRQRLSTILGIGLAFLLVLPAGILAQDFRIFVPFVDTAKDESAISIAAVPTNTGPLRSAVNADGIITHLEAFQAIADANNGTRASGTPGYDASAQYVADLLTTAGYDVTVQEFDFPFFHILGMPTFEQTDPTPTTYELFDLSTSTGDFDVMTYSGSGTITEIEVVPTNDVIIPFPANANTSNSGCEAADYFDGDGSNLVAGKVALIQRGTCTFAEKAAAAEAAGALAALIFNEGQPDLDRDGVTLGQLGAPGINIPVIGISYALGVEFYNAYNDDLEPRVSLDVQAESEIRPTANVIAETQRGRADRVVLVGAHLDSVPEGPGINDNGSGSAMILEIALQLQEQGISPRNKVRFAFWGAEEFNLLGSGFYVANLTKREIKNIAVNLNFDMVASPNYVRYVYDGDGSATPQAGPNGSGRVEAIFLDYFAEQGLEVEPTAFDGRSDYGPFIAVGIPAGGLFTGAEGTKTPQEAAIYGGTAGIAYDPCYHQACDTLNEENNNINEEVLEQMADAATHAILTFAMTTSAVNGTGRASSVAAENLEFHGSERQK